MGKIGLIFILSLVLVFAAGCKKTETPATSAAATPTATPAPASPAVPDVEAFTLVKEMRSMDTDSFNAKYAGKTFLVKNILVKTVWVFEDKSAPDNLSGLAFDPAARMVSWTTPSTFKGEPLKNLDTDVYVDSFLASPKDAEGLNDAATKDQTGVTHYDFGSLYDVTATIDKQDGGNTIKLSNTKIIKK